MGDMRGDLVGEIILNGDMHKLVSGKEPPCATSRFLPLVQLVFLFSMDLPYFL